VFSGVHALAKRDASEHDVITSFASVRSRARTTGSTEEHRHKHGQKMAAADNVSLALTSKHNQKIAAVLARSSECGGTNTTHYRVAFGMLPCDVAL
jgi:hypothetical protein